MSTDYDVAIVGCGPVGMVLAALLEGEGVRVLAVEREDEIGFRPRARHLDAEAVRVLQTVGVAEAVERVMVPLGGLRLADASGRTLLEQPIDSTRPGEQGWIDDYQLFQPRLLKILYDHLLAGGNAVVRTGHEVVSLDQHTDHVRLVISDRATGHQDVVTSQYAVGCDGADSWVREAIGSRFQKLGPDDRYLVIDGTPVRPDFKLPAHPISVNVCDPARPHYVSPGNEWVPLRLEFMVMPGETSEEMLAPEKINSLTAPYLKPGDVHFDRTAVYTFHSLLVDQWRVGRVFLAGDAAHVQPPFMGQGLCSGFRDASNLSWKLGMVCRGEVGDELLDSYQTERSPHARDWITEANRVGAIVMTTDADEAKERDKRLLRGDFREIRPIKPALGLGLHGADPRPAGTLAPQPFLPDGRRLDELVGRRFLVAASTEVWNGVEPETRQDIERSGNVIVLTTDSGNADALLSHFDTAAVVLRPDRYVLGVASDSRELEQVLLRIPGRPSRASVTTA